MENRDRKITIRFTEKEGKIIDKKAKRKKMCVSEFIRKELF